jgi:hypothetical protein
MPAATATEGREPRRGNKAWICGDARARGWAQHVRLWVTYTPTGGRAHSTKTTFRVLAAKH